MCVIMLADTKRPTEEMLELANEQNPAGAGIAWREETPAGNVVCWEKGITLDRITELSKKVTLPFVVHFRIPTAGGKRDELCHPFPIDRKASQDLTGRTRGYVLFHNGHWARWEDEMWDAQKKCKLPIGKWSDSRAMAWTVSVYGNINALEFTKEKIIAYGPEGLNIFGSGWSEVDGVWCSNQHWKKYGTTTYYGTGHRWTGTLCMERSCQMHKLDGSDYCYKHQSLGTKLPNDEDDAKGSVSKVTVTHPIKAPGGAPTVIPFDQLDLMLARKEISKSQFKKRRKLWIKAQNQISKDLKARLKKQEQSASIH